MRSKNKQKQKYKGGNSSFDGQDTTSVLIRYLLIAHDL